MMFYFYLGQMPIGFFNEEIKVNRCQYYITLKVSHGLSEQMS